MIPACSGVGEVTARVFYAIQHELAALLPTASLRPRCRKLQKKTETPES